MAYEFTLEGFYQVETPDPVLNYIYPEPGQYAISVRVKDNEGAWPDPVRSVVTVSE